MTRKTDREQFINDVEMGLYASKIISYAQGYALMVGQAESEQLELKRGIALCGAVHHRSVFLGKIKEAFDRNAKLVNLLVDPFFAGEIGRAQSGGGA